MNFYGRKKLSMDGFIGLGSSRTVRMNRIIVGFCRHSLKGKRPRKLTIEHLYLMALRENLRNI